MLISCTEKSSGLGTWGAQTLWCRMTPHPTGTHSAGSWPAGSWVEVKNHGEDVLPWQCWTDPRFEGTLVSLLHQPLWVWSETSPSPRLHLSEQTKEQQMFAFNAETRNCLSRHRISDSFKADRHELKAPISNPSPGQLLIFRHFG